MVNDLTTVEGSLQEVIDKLETNLGLMGVTASFNSTTGILGLIDEILNITGSVGGLIINTSFDCNISQNTVYLGDSVTLTGKLNAEFNDTSSEDDDLSGVIQHGTVKIYNGDTLIGSVQTGNDGSFSFSYTPNSTGALSLKAIYESNTYSSSYSSSFVVNVLELSVDEIVLTSDKSILSYSDGESATLTAQLMYDGVSVSVSNVPVEFMVYDEDDTLINTLNGVTDSTGLATVSYHSQGTGNISIKATTSNIFSNNIQIEDLEYYNPNTYSTSNLEIDLSNEFTLPQNFEMKFTVIYYGEKKNTGIYFGSSINNRCNIGINGSPNDNGITFYTGSWEEHNSQLKLPTNIEVEIKYTYINGVHSYYVNNDLKVQFTKIWEYRTFIYLIVQTYLKDLKIKKL